MVCEGVSERKPARRDLPEFEGAVIAAGGQKCAIGTDVKTANATRSIEAVKESAGV